MDAIETNIRRIKINNTDVFLEPLGEGRGKITISDTYEHNYSYFWGAMGGTLETFLCKINSEYFADKLLGSKSNYEMDVKATFKGIRKFLKTEMNLPWYKHLYFQKDMRQKLNEFEEMCKDEPSQNFFVTMFFNSFINILDFYLIEDRYEQKIVEKDFKGICEQWNFICEKPGKQYIWLVKLHADLKNRINTLSQITPPNQARREKII